MKKSFSFILSLVLLLFLASCGDNVKSNEIHIPNIDIHEDMEEYQTEDDKTYYTSKYISFVREVKGYFETDIPFTVSDDENIRIYDDLYFYEGDSFYLISSDYRYIWATLANEQVDYANVLREQGEDIHVDIKKDGIYKITLDMKTMVMDLSYKNEITKPYYYPFKTICVGCLVDGSIVYTDLSVNPSNENEFAVKDYDVEAGKLYFFYNQFTHISCYKLTIANDSKEYLASTTYSDCYTFKIAGKYNIYVNNKTYEIRAELDPSSATYYCLTYNEGFIELNPVQNDTPYIFEYEYEATSDVGGYGVVSDSLPKFYDKGYNEYSFTVIESDLLGENKGSYYFKKKGTYIITINLLDFTISVAKK